MLVTPKRLRNKGRIAVVAPAAAFLTDELNQGLDVMKEKGFRPILAPNVRKLNTIGALDAPVMDRVSDLMWALTSDDIDAVVCVIGGFGSAELLPHLNYDAIRRSAKPFIGKSDITALNCGILKRAGLINFNGKTAMVRRSKSGNGYISSDSKSLSTTLDLLSSDEPWYDEPFKANQYIPRCITPGVARGRAIGGNLDTLCCLLGTPYFPKPDGTILFIEDVHKSGMEIARKLLHIKLAGVLDRVAGVVVGEFCDVPGGVRSHGDPDITDALQYYLRGVPSSFGYSFSHGTNVIPIPIGAETVLDAESGDVQFNFKMA